MLVKVLSTDNVILLTTEENWERALNIPVSWAETPPVLTFHDRVDVVPSGKLGDIERLAYLPPHLPDLYVVGLGHMYITARNGKESKSDEVRVFRPATVWEALTICRLEACLIQSLPRAIPRDWIGYMPRA